MTDRQLGAAPSGAPGAFGSFSLIPALLVGGGVGLAVTDWATFSALLRIGSTDAVKAGTLWEFNPSKRDGYALTSAGASLKTDAQVAVLRGGTAPAGHDFISNPPIKVTKGQKLRLEWKMRAVGGRMQVGLMDGNSGAWLSRIDITDKDVVADVVATGDSVFIVISNASGGLGPPVVELGPGRLISP